MELKVEKIMNKFSKSILKSRVFYQFFQLGSLVGIFLYLIVKTTFEEIGEHNYRNRKGNSDNEIIDSPALLWLLSIISLKKYIL